MVEPTSNSGLEAVQARLVGKVYGVVTSTVMTRQVLARR